MSEARYLEFNKRRQASARYLHLKLRRQLYLSHPPSTLTLVRNMVYIKAAMMTCHRSKDRHSLAVTGECRSKTLMVAMNVLLEKPYVVQDMIK